MGRLEVLPSRSQSAISSTARAPGARGKTRDHRLRHSASRSRGSRPISAGIEVPERGGRVAVVTVGGVVGHSPDAFNSIVGTNAHHRIGHVLFRQVMGPSEALHLGADHPDLNPVNAHGIGSFAVCQPRLMGCRGITVLTFYPFHGLAPTAICWCGCAPQPGGPAPPTASAFAFRLGFCDSPSRGE